MLNTLIMPIIIILICILYMILEITSFRKQQSLLKESSVAYETVREGQYWFILYLVVAGLLFSFAIQEYRIIQETNNQELILNVISVGFMSMFFIVKAVATQYTNVLYYTNDQILIRARVIKLKDIKNLNRRGIIMKSYEIVENGSSLRLFGLKKIPIKIDELYRNKKGKRR